MTWGDIWKWVLAPKGTITVVLFGIAVAFLGGSIATDGPFGQGAAAWVQAIGSVAAIAAAVEVDRRSRNMRREERSQDLRARKAIVQECMMSTRHLAAALVPANWNGLNRPARKTYIERQSRANRLLGRLIERAPVLPNMDGYQLYVERRMQEVSMIIADYGIAFDTDAVPGQSVAAASVERASIEIRDATRRLAEGRWDLVKSGED